MSLTKIPHYETQQLLKIYSEKITRKLISMQQARLHEPPTQINTRISCEAFQPAYKPI